MVFLEVTDKRRTLYFMHFKTLLNKRLKSQFRDVKSVCLITTKQHTRTHTGPGVGDFLFNGSAPTPLFKISIIIFGFSESREQNEPRHRLVHFMYVFRYSLSDEYELYVRVSFVSKRLIKINLTNARS